MILQQAHEYFRRRAAWPCACVTRFAPSVGRLHLGHGLNAMLNWYAAAQRGGLCVCMPDLPADLPALVQGNVYTPRWQAADMRDWQHGRRRRQRIPWAEFFYTDLACLPHSVARYVYPVPTEGLLTWMWGGCWADWAVSGEMRPYKWGGRLGRHKAYAYAALGVNCLIRGRDLQGTEHVAGNIETLRAGGMEPQEWFHPVLRARGEKVSKSSGNSAGLGLAELLRQPWEDEETWAAGWGEYGRTAARLLLLGAYCAWKFEGRCPTRADAVWTLHRRLDLDAVCAGDDWAWDPHEWRHCADTVRGWCR